MVINFLAHEKYSIEAFFCLRGHEVVLVEARDHLTDSETELLRSFQEGEIFPEYLGDAFGGELKSGKPVFARCSSPDSAKEAVKAVITSGESAGLPLDDGRSVDFQDEECGDWLLPTTLTHQAEIDLRRADYTQGDSGIRMDTVPVADRVVVDVCEGSHNKARALYFLANQSIFAAFLQVIYDTNKSFVRIDSQQTLIPIQDKDKPAVVQYDFFRDVDGQICLKTLWAVKLKLLTSNRIDPSDGSIQDTVVHTMDSDRSFFSIEATWVLQGEEELWSGEDGASVYLEGDRYYLKPELFELSDLRYFIGGILAEEQI